MIISAEQNSIETNRKHSQHFTYRHISIYGDGGVNCNLLRLI